MTHQHAHHTTPPGGTIPTQKSGRGPDPLPLKSSGYGSGTPEARSLGGSDGPGGSQEGPGGPQDVVPITAGTGGPSGGAGASEDVLARTIDAFMLSMSNAFDGVFARPDIARTMLGFMQGDVVFVVTNTELQVRRREEVDPPPVDLKTGQYL